jgi:hypothetical protein
MIHAAQYLWDLHELEQGLASFCRETILFGEAIAELGPYSRTFGATIAHPRVGKCCFATETSRPSQKSPSYDWHDKLTSL